MIIILHISFYRITDMRVQETSAIHRMWGGYLRSQVKCCKCGYESNTYETILDLSLEIKGTSVHSALKNFTDPEILDGENKYKCTQFCIQSFIHSYNNVFEIQL